VCNAGHRHTALLHVSASQRTLEKLYHEVREGAQNWDVMTNRYFDTVEQQEILNKADHFLSEVNS